MSTFRRIGKVVGGYKVIVSCTNTPMEERVFSTSEACYAFADEYLEKNYFGVALTSIHHPKGDGIEPECLNADSLETVEIEIPMSKRLKELAVQAGLEELGDGDWCSLNHPDVRAEHLERFAELVRQDEREACARTCDDMSEGLVGDDNADGATGAGYCANAIRARENHEQTR